MEPLDDLAYFRRLDPEHMLERIQEFPEQCRVAWSNAVGFSWPRPPDGLQNIVVAGMGGSAIAGELVAELVAGSCPVPILLHRNYGLPAFVGPHSLLVASSYSGNTAETLSAVREGLRRGIPIIGLATGGELGKMAAEAGFPLFTIRYQSKPRAALAHSFMALLHFLERLELIPHQQEAVDSALSTLQAMEGSLGPQVLTADNLAKQLAHNAYNRLPVIYGVGFLAPVAHRWRTQINENVKGWAFSDALPEMNHNAIVGYEQPDELASESLVILLDSPLNAAELRQRTDVTAEILSRAGIRYQVIEAEGRTVLDQMLSTVHLGDYVSFYLAALYGVDPTPMPGIDLLKERLQEKKRS